jgi:hypothetical protein
LVKQKLRLMVKDNKQNNYKKQNKNVSKIYNCAIKLQNKPEKNKNKKKYLNKQNKRR